MSKTVAGLLGFIGGLVLGYCAVLFGWVAYTNLFDVFDREGAGTDGDRFFLCANRRRHRGDTQCDLARAAGGARRKRNDARMSLTPPQAAFLADWGAVTGTA